MAVINTTLMSIDNNFKDKPKNVKKKIRQISKKKFYK